MPALLNELYEILGEVGLLQGKDVSSRPRSWADSTPCQAMAIARPASTQELADVMKTCHHHDQVVIPLGGGTGLVHAVEATTNQLLVSLERMNNIEPIDLSGSTITVEAGAILQNVQEIAKNNDLFFPIDLGARGSAQIGGLIATNAGGNQVLRYGMMREQVLGLEVVLADGTIISSMNNMLKNNAGYDLKQLFIGAEGTLGIVTRAVLRLRPLMVSKSTALVAVKHFSKIPTLLKTMAASLGGTLNSYEVLWNNFYTLITDAHPERVLPLSNEHPFYVLIESCSANKETDKILFESALEQAFKSELIVDAAIAQNEKQSEGMWAIRDDIETIMHKLSPLIAFDISIPIALLDNFVNVIEKKLTAKWGDSAKFVSFGHLGDSNIHLVITVGSGGHEVKQAVMDIIYSEVSTFNGSISAEHGIGLEKVNYLHHSRSSDEINLMRTLKTALDPKTLLNPGRVFNIK